MTVDSKYFPEDERLMESKAFAKNIYGLIVGLEFLEGRLQRKRGLGTAFTGEAATLFINTESEKVCSEAASQD